MADKKISELTAATTVNDDDQLPLVQSGDTLSLDASVLRAYVTADSTLVKVDVNQVLSVANSITERGHYSKGAFNGTYTDGIVLDYTTGTGRISVGSGDGLSIYNGGVAGTALLNLDSSGNLGLGVAPSAWSGAKALQLPGGALSGYSNGTDNNQVLVLGNAYFNGATPNYIYSDSASYYRQYSGTHAWFTAPSGTAGSAISFTQAMTLDASGRLVLGATSTSYNLDVVGASGVTSRVKSNSGSTGNYAQLILDSYNSFSGTGQAYLRGVSSVSGNSNTDLAFGVNQSGFGAPYEAMRLTAAGYLGIGTTSPAAQLQVNSASGGTTARFANTSSGNFIDFYVAGGSRQGYIGTPDGTNFYLHSDSATGAMVFETNNTEKMRLTSAGNLGIGTSSPNAALFVATQAASVTSSTIGVGIGSSASTASVELFGSTTGAALIDFAPADGVTDFKGRIFYNLNTNYFEFSTNGSAKMLLDSSGNLGLGVTPKANNGVRTLLVADQGGTLNALTLGARTGQYGEIGYGFGFNVSAYKYLENDYASKIGFASGGVQFYNAPSGTAGNAISFTQAMTLDASGNLGVGTTSPAAKFEAVISGTARLLIGYAGGSANYFDANDNIFRSGSGTERARIDSSGNFLVGTTSANANLSTGIQIASTNWASAFQVTASANAGTCSALSRSTDGNVAQFYRGTAFTTLVGSISVTSSATAYNTSSDQRLKTNVTPAGSAIQSILDFPIDQFDWISSGEHQDFGAVAQKTINVIPEMVSVPADPDEMWGIDWSKAVPRLIRTAQEQHEMILALRDELEQVKATLH